MGTNHPLQSFGAISFSDIEKEKLFDGDEAKSMEDMVTGLDAINDIVLNELSPPHTKIEAGPPYNVSDWYGYNHLATGSGDDNVITIIGEMINLNFGGSNDVLYKHLLKQTLSDYYVAHSNHPEEDEYPTVSIGQSFVCFMFGTTQQMHDGFIDWIVQVLQEDILDSNYGCGSGLGRCYLKFPTSGLPLLSCLSGAKIKITGSVLYVNNISSSFVLVYFGKDKINHTYWMDMSENKIISTEVVSYANGEMEWTLNSEGISLLSQIISDPFQIDPFIRIGIVEYEHDYCGRLWFGISDVTGNNSTFDTIGSWGKSESDVTDASVTGGVVDDGRLCMKIVNSTVTEYPLSAALTYSALPEIHTDDFMIISFDYKWPEPLTGILKKSHLHIGDQEVGCGTLEKAMFGSSISGWPSTWKQAARIEKFNDEDPFYGNLHIFTLESGTQAATSPPTTLLIDNFQFTKIDHDVSSLIVHYCGGIHFTNPRLEITVIVPLVPDVTTSDISVYTNTTIDAGGNCVNNNGAEIEEVGVCYSSVNSTPTISDNCLVCGISLGLFSGVISGLTANTPYYVRAYAKNSVGAGYGTVKTITTKTVPTVVTMNVSSVVSILTGGAESESTSEFDCGLTITSNGGGTISSSGLVGNVVNPPTGGHWWYNIPATNTPFYKHVDDALLNNSYPTFYIRAFATNEYGTGYGEVKSFVADFSGLATVVTDTATSIGNTSAYSGGTVTNSGTSSVTERGVCWGTSSNPTIIANNHTHDGTGTGHFGSTLSSLSPGTIYYYRAYAVNSSGTAYGDNLYFITTNSSVASVSTVSVASIAQTTASSGGNSISDGGSAITHKGVCWATLTSPTIANSHTDNGTGTANFSSSLTDLIAGTTYYVRAYITNGVETYYGSNVTFTTLGGTASVVTSDAGNIGKTTATVGGESIYDGGSAITDKGVAYGTSVNPTIAGDHVHGGSGVANFTVGLTGLSAGTTYHIRAFVVNNSQSTPYYGADKTFVTTSNVMPVVITSTPSDILNTSFKAGGNVTDDGGSSVIARGVCWNGGGSPTISDSTKTMGTGTGVFSDTITGLVENAVYYLKAYATNSIDTSYGEEKIVTMLGKPKAITIADVSSITVNSAVCGGSVGYDGGSVVFSRGVCWNTNPAVDPTTADNLTSNGSGTGLFTSNLTGLSATTTYYVRAYATNYYGTTYSTKKNTFATIGSGARAAVMSTPVFVRRDVGPGFYADVTDVGSPVSNYRAICWGESVNPTIDGSHVTATLNTDLSPQQLSGTIPTGYLTPGTTYHIRMYMTDGIWTAYSPDITYLHVIKPTIRVSAAAFSAQSNHIQAYWVYTDGGGTITNYGYQRGTTYGIYEPMTWVGMYIDNPFWWNQDFIVGVTYYLRMGAVNEAGVGYGDIYTFVKTL